MPETDIAGVVRIRVRSGTLGSITWDGKPLKIIHGMGLDVVDAVTDESLLLVTSLRLHADPTGMVTVELTELADENGEPARMGKRSDGPPYPTFRETYDPDTGDVLTVTNTYFLAGIEEVD